jgi:hypothetical protein
MLLEEKPPESERLFGLRLATFPTHLGSIRHRVENTPIVIVFMSLRRWYTRDTPMEDRHGGPRTMTQGVRTNAWNTLPESRSYPMMDPAVLMAWGKVPW